MSAATGANPSAVSSTGMPTMWATMETYYALKISERK